MKNKLIATAFLLFAAHAQTSAQSLTIYNNNPSCTVYVSLGAQNSSGTYTACNALHTAKLISIAASSSVSYSNIDDLNLSTCPTPGSGPGWTSGGTGVCASSGGAWDEIIFSFSSSGPYLTLDLSSCAGTTISGSMSDCTGTIASASWYSPTNTVTIN